MDLVFDYLKKFKDIPTYQLERRIDALILPYLVKALTAKLKQDGIEVDDIKLLYPEFPLRPSFNQQSKRSKHADYLLWSKNLNTVYLTELKTDIGSIDEDQFQNYVLNCSNGWNHLLLFYLEKSIHNPNWRKFVSGLLCLKEGEGILGTTGDWELHQFLIRPKGINKRLVELKDSISFNSNPQVQFLYLAPTNSSTMLNLYRDKHDRQSVNYLGLITLEELSRFCDSGLRSLLIQIDNRRN